MTSFETMLLRSRYCVWPEDETAKNAWPCRCSDPAFAVEDGSWECPHGKWEFISSWDSVPPLAKNHTLEECRGGDCSQHGLIAGPLLELHLSSQVGLGWGDIVLTWDEMAYNQMSQAERSALVVKQKAADEAFLTNLASEEIRKAKSLLEKKTLVRKYSRTGLPLPCKWVDRPAEHGWPAGCGLHAEGVCPFFHKNEPEWSIIIGLVKPTPRPIGSWR